MTAVDRSFILGQLHDSRRVQEGRAQLPDEKTTHHKRLQAEARSYTLSLLIDAVNKGLLEQLHDEAQQALFLDVAVDQDRAWAAYMAGIASPPESTAPLAIAMDDEQPKGPDGTAHYGGMQCPGCPECIGYTDPNEPDNDEDEDDASNAAAPDLITAMGHHSSTHGTAAAYNPADPHDAALAQQARAEYVDYAEAEAVREINELMDLDAAGVDSWEEL